MIALLDVNLVVALFDPEHIHYHVAHDWFAENREWATCPLTENGALRVLADPALDLGMPLAGLARALQRFCEHREHRFWPDDLSLLNTAVVDFSHIRGHKQLTDVYLLALAVKNDGTLVTFDDSIPLAAVKGAQKDHLLVLAPAA